MQIDRRDALKKLAVGGVTAATASAVISSPVFADDTPIPPASPIVNAAVDALGLTLIVTLGPGTATCNGNASGIASVAGSSQTSLADTSILPIIGIEGVLDVESQAGSTSLQTIAFAAASGAGSQQAQINYRVLYRCTYGAVIEDLLRFWTIKFDFEGNEWSTLPSQIILN